MHNNETRHNSDFLFQNVTVDGMNDLKKQLDKLCKIQMAVSEQMFTQDRAITHEVKAVQEKLELQAHEVSTVHRKLDLQRKQMDCIQGNQKKLSDQIFTQGKVSVQIQDHLATKIILHAGNASAIKVKFRKKILTDYQDHLETYLDPSSELLDKLRMRGVINENDMTEVNNDSTRLGKVKRILLAVDNGNDTIGEFVFCLLDCSKHTTNRQLGEMLNDDEAVT